MSEQRLSDSVLQIIEQKEIKPKSKWSFLLKNWVIWIVGILAVLIGALAISIVIAVLRSNDWDIYREFGQSLPRFFLSTMPYLWLIILGLFILIANYQIQHTKHGYRYPILVIALILIGVSAVLGTLFYGVGVGHALNHRLNEESPLYRQFVDKKADRWAHPEAGFLFGEVQDIVDNSEFAVRDFDGKKWNVTDNTVSENPRIKIEEGIRLRLIGEKTGDAEFEAKRILPWDIREKGKQRLQQHIRDKINIERRIPPLRTR